MTGLYAIPEYTPAGYFLEQARSFQTRIFEASIYRARPLIYTPDMSFLACVFLSNMYDED
jgi:hypothetical protein